MDTVTTPPHGADRLPAMLFLGPTGAGKTPLGRLLAIPSADRVRCHHFDFGQNLRRVASRGARDRILTDEEQAVVRQVLSAGTLLEDGQFGIAIKILNNFLKETGYERGDVLILNGLPRHVGQAGKLEGIVDVRLVIVLKSLEQVTYERIMSNAWGDRAGRTDDSPPEIANKLAIFEGRTKPLIEHYRKRGTRVETIETEVRTAIDEVLGIITKMMNETY